MSRAASILFCVGGLSCVDRRHARDGYRFPPPALKSTGKSYPPYSRAAKKRAHSLRGAGLMQDPLAGKVGVGSLLAEQAAAGA